MNKNMIYTPPPAGQPLRKSGVAAGFINGTEDYLELVRTDLGLGCTHADMMQIRQLWRSRKTEPTVADLYFDAEAIRTGCLRYDAARLCAALSADDAVKELLTGLMSRYMKTGYASGQESAPPFFGLAEFAMGVKNAGLNEYSADITPNRAPLCPLPGASSPVFIQTDRVTVTVSKGKTTQTKPTGSVVLLKPGASQDLKEFIFGAHGVYNQLCAEYGPLFCMSCTDRGLLRDLCGMIPGGFVNCEAIPGDNRYPECALQPQLPGLLICVPQYIMSRTLKLCSDFGVSSSVVVPRIFDSSDERYFSVSVPGSVTLSVNEERLRAYNYVLPLTLNADAAPLNGRGVIDVIKPPELPDAEAVEIGGSDIYGALCDAVEPDGIYACLAELDIKDPGAVPLILTLDSFVRNQGVKFAVCRAVPGDRCALTLVKIGNSIN